MHSNTKVFTLEPGSCREADFQFGGTHWSQTERALALRSTQHLGPTSPWGKEGGSDVTMKDWEGAWPTGTLPSSTNLLLFSNPASANLCKRVQTAQLMHKSLEGGRLLLKAPPCPGILGMKVRKTPSQNKQCLKTWIFLGTMESEGKLGLPEIVKKELLGRSWGMPVLGPVSF